jgi:hypothetical protein
MIFKGQCHCGAILVELTTGRQPSDQVLGAFQCTFCRKGSLYRTPALVCSALSITAS